jgi:hypothetical protein
MIDIGLALFVCYLIIIPSKCGMIKCGALLSTPVEITISLIPIGSPWWQPSEPMRKQTKTKRQLSKRLQEKLSILSESRHYGSYRFLRWIQFIVI